VNIDDTPLPSSYHGSCIHRVRQEGANELSIVPGNIALFSAVFFLLGGILFGLFGDHIPSIRDDWSASRMRDFFGVSAHALITFGFLFNMALAVGVHCTFQRLGTRVHCNRASRTIRVSSGIRKLNRHFSFDEIETVQVCDRHDKEHHDSQMILVVKQEPPERLLVIGFHPKKKVLKMAGTLANFMGVPVLDSTGKKG
jgi:hypothetical protein